MKNRKAGLWFILITVTLDMIGIGLVIPSLPDIMRRFVSDEASISTYFGYFISVYALMQFIASPLLGSISDRYGRRSVLLVSLLIASMDYVLMAFAPTLTILFIGRVIAGLTGANITVAMAYIADVSTDKDRSSNFGMIGAAFGLGFIIGPALGGLLGHYGAFYPFLAAAGLNLLNFLFGLFILPESLPAENRRKLDWKRSNPLASIQRVLNAKHILALLGVYFLFQCAGHTHGSIWTLYTEKRYGWTTAQVGLSLTLVGLLSAISQGWLTRLVIPKIGERSAVLWGCFGIAIAYALFGAATQGWMMYAILIASSICWVAGPALQSLITHSTPAHEQGELQGSLVSLSSLAAIFTPLITTGLFSHFSNSSSAIYLPGAPYYFASLTCVVGLLLLLRKR